MKTLIILILLPTFLLSQEKTYFEETYKIKLLNVREKSSYKDEKVFYKEVAKELEIDKLAHEKVEKKFKWKPSYNQMIMVQTKRLKKTWFCTVTKVSPPSDMRKGDFKHENVYVEINDKKKIVYMDKQKPKQP